MEEFYNSQTPPSEGRGSTSTNTLSRILQTPHFELLGKQRTWVTLYQEVQTSRSTPNQMMHLKDEDGEKPCPEDLKHWILVRGSQHRRLKSPFLIKKDDPGVPSIECTINGYSFQKTVYDTGSDVNGHSHLSAPAWNHAPTTKIHSAPDDFQVINMREDESGQEEDNTTATRGGKSSRMDGQTTKEK